MIGFIDCASGLGQRYLAHLAENVFYRDAPFYLATGVEQRLDCAGFAEPEWPQTLSKPLEATREIKALRAGYGGGAFVVRAQ